jgi:hypothetical protein
MTDSVAVRATQPAVQNLVSKSSNWPILLTGRCDSGTIDTITVVVGVSGGVPTTFADLAKTSVHTPENDSSQFSFNQSGGVNAYSMILDAALNGTLVAGVDQVRVCIVDVPSPIASTPILAASGQFGVAA